MPQFTFTGALTANQVGKDFLTSWQYRYVPFPARIDLIDNTTGAANNVQRTIYSGSETIVQRSPVSAGGTSGVIPAPLNYPPISWMAAAGDLLLILYDETAGATPVVNGIIYISPA